MEDDKILEFDAMADSKMVVTKVVGGTYDGLYTIMDASGKYLYAASSSGNQLKSAALSTSTPQHYYWSIVENEGVYEIIASKSANRNVMQFNYNNGSPIFNCYSSASQKAVALYAYSDIKPDTKPKISVTNTAYSVKATDTSVDIPYTVKNITDAISASVADGATMSNVSANVTEGKVTVSFAANEESAEKTATIVLSYEGAQSVNVVITQAGKPAEEGDGTPAFVKVTSAPSDWSGTYLIVCEKANVAFDGSLTTLDAVGNEIKVTIENNQIAYSASLVSSTFEIAKSGDAYTIKSASGYYIGRTSNSNGFNSSKTTSYTNTIAITNGTLTVISSAGPKLQYYSASGSQRFRYYNSSQQAISLYRLEGDEIGGETPVPGEPETPVEPTLTPRNLAFSAATATATVGQPFTAPTLNGEKTGVKYSSTNTNVATVNETTGAVTLVAAGTTTITATAPKTAEYEAGEASYTLTVSGATGTNKTYTWTASSKGLGESPASTITKDLNGVNWSVKRTTKSGSPYTGWSSNCIQIGKNGGVENLVLTTSAFSGVIKKVSVECSSYNAAHNVSISVGNTSYLSSTPTAKWTTVSAASGTGESSGIVQISFTGGTRAMYIKSITIEYVE